MLVVTEGGAPDEEAVMVDVCINACCGLVVRLEREERVGMEELGTFSLLGPTLTLLAGRASTLIQVYDQKGLGVCL